MTIASAAVDRSNSMLERLAEEREHQVSTDGTASQNIDSQWRRSIKTVGG